jgi:hypothetical protein
MRRMEKMEVENREAKRAAKSTSICEECVHAQGDCPDEAMVLNYMKGELPNFCFGQYGKVTEV